MEGYEGGRRSIYGQNVSYVKRSKLNINGQWEARIITNSNWEKI